MYNKAGSDIHWLKSDGSLQIGTSNGRWALIPGDGTAGYAAGNVRLKKQSGIGVADVNAQFADNLYFVRIGGRNLIATRTDQPEVDLNRFNTDITEGLISKISVQNTPFRIVWCFSWH